VLSGLYFHSIYTDGSWQVKHTLSSLLLNRGVVETAGAIVLHTNRGLFPVKIEMDVETNSAYDAEVVALLVAHELAKDRVVKIWTDCSSAIKCLNGGGLGSYAQILAGWKKRPNVSFLNLGLIRRNTLCPVTGLVRRKGITLLIKLLVERYNRWSL
jgi:hypothetical protein